MKIAVVVSTFPPYRGGIGNVAYHDALVLAKLGHQVEVFTPNYDGQSEGAIPEWRLQCEEISMDKNKFQIHYLKPLFKFGQGAVLWGLSKKLKAGNFDVVHLHYPNFTGAQSVWWAKTTKRIKKLVLHYHMDLVAGGWKGLIFKTYTKLMMPFIIKSADKVIVTSLDYGRQSNIAWLKDKLIEVPNGVDIERFLPKERDAGLLAKYGLIGKQVIGFVGALDKAHYFKGVDKLIKAFYFLYNAGRQEGDNHNCRLLIVGGGDLKKDYHDLARQLGLADKVIFTGFVKDEDLPQHYNLMDVFVLPSIDKSEAFGLVLVEAMACAKPVIASNLAGVRSVVDDGVNGLLANPGDEQDLANKINYLIQNPELAKSFGLAGRKKAEVKYGWGIIGERLEEIFTKL